MNLKLVKSRLGELIGGEKQKEAAKMLYMTQGNVSKILSDPGHKPSIDVIYEVAKKYGVSADWILGLTDEKMRYNTKSYAMTVENLQHLIGLGAKLEDTGKYSSIKIAINDILVMELLRKSMRLSETDREYHAKWKQETLSKFADKELLLAATWEDRNILDAVSGNSNNDEYLFDLYEEGKHSEDALLDLMGGIHETE